MASSCVGAILVVGERLLLGRRAVHLRAYPGCWDVIGGHVEAGETLEQALVREVKEEIGVTPVAFAPLSALEFPDGAEGTGKLQIYRVDAWTGGAPAIRNDEHSELRWFGVDAACALPDLAASAYVEVFRAIGTRTDRFAMRRAVMSDAPALNGLARAAYDVHVPVIGREPMPMAADWAALLGEQEIWVIEDAAADMVASLALEVRDDHLVIWSVAVAPAHQHRGIGRRLIAFAEARAAELRRREVRLFTNARMFRNVALYERLGYAETYREELPDRVIVHMSKVLDGAGRPSGGKREASP